MTYMISDSDLILCYMCITRLLYMCMRHANYVQSIVEALSHPIDTELSGHMLRLLFLLKTFTSGPFLGWLGFFVFELNMINVVVIVHCVFQLLFSSHQVRKQGRRSIDNLRDSWIDIDSKWDPSCIQDVCIINVTMGIRRCLCVRFTPFAHHLIGGFFDTF
jgi:hypothetical protein